MRDSRLDNRFYNLPHFAHQPSPSESHWVNIWVRKGSFHTFPPICYASAFIHSRISFGSQTNCSFHSCWYSPINNFVEYSTSPCGAAYCTTHAALCYFVLQNQSVSIKLKNCFSIVDPSGVWSHVVQASRMCLEKCIAFSIATGN